MTGKRDGLGIALTGDYEITLSDGTRGTIRKVGKRHYLKFPQAKMRVRQLAKKHLTKKHRAS